MEMEKFSEILKNRIKEKKMTQRSLAAVVGSTPPQVNNIIKGRERLGAKNTPAWADALGIDPLWLMTQGEQGTPPDEGAPLDTAQPPEDIILVPVINLDMRGGLQPNDVVDAPEYITETMPFSRSIASDGDVVAPVYGDSMAPRYPSGSHILIRPLPMWREWLELGLSYVLELNDWRRTIKIVRKGTREDTYRLESYNVDYDTTEIPKAIIAHVWQVLACVKREVM